MDPTAAANDVSKLTAEEARSISKKMFLGGFFALPLLWLINALYFRSHLRSGGDGQVRRYVVWSLLGGTLELLVVAAWYVVFYRQWYTWGRLGEQLAVVWSWGVQ